MRGASERVRFISGMPLALHLHASTKGKEFGMAGERMDENLDYDPKGERGGDTGKTDQKGKGKQAEKGDQRREEPMHSGPTRRGAQGKDHEHSKRSGSESDASR
ncbi:MAG: hypothetical protein ACJ789_04905 [Thermomicrobiales bacterium]